MKRMNLIHGALLVVMTFMGSLSLSAQSWLPPAQAAVVITNELNGLDVQPAPTPAAGVSSKKDILAKNAAVGCADCQEKHVKKQYLRMVAAKLKNGVATGTAVEEVRTEMLNNAGNNVSLIQNVQNVYEFVVGLLS
jgi:hypothetical protein